MSSTYRNATFVAAWLGHYEIGENDRSSSQAIDFLESGRKEWEALYETSSQTCGQMSTAIADLCNRAYWRRLWVV